MGWPEAGVDETPKKNRVTIRIDSDGREGCLRDRARCPRVKRGPERTGEEGLSPGVRWGGVSHPSINYCGEAGGKHLW